MTALTIRRDRTPEVLRKLAKAALCFPCCCEGSEGLAKALNFGEKPRQPLDGGGAPKACGSPAPSRCGPRASEISMPKRLAILSFKID